ncbi:MAG: zinc ribbon domain-containing protein, partial [Phycisphaerales bacterium JB039]
LAAEAGELETESAAQESRIEKLRAQMNAAKTNKEYQTFLVEINTLKVQKGEIESEALERMTRVDELKTQLAEVEAQLTERRGMHKVAVEDRDKRAAEIKDRVEELQAQRKSLAAEAPPAVLRTYEELLAQRDEDAMAPVELQDKRRHEFTCGGCMMSLTVETVSGLLSHGRLTRCTSCGCILYLTEDVRDVMQPAKR